MNFEAKKLFGAVGEIIDGSIAYVTMKGGGPTEQHTHGHNCYPEAASGGPISFCRQKATGERKTARRTIRLVLLDLPDGERGSAPFDPLAGDGGLRGTGAEKRIATAGVRTGFAINTCLHTTINENVL